MIPAKGRLWYELWDGGLSPTGGGHSGRITSLSLLPHGGSLLSSSCDGSVRCFAPALSDHWTTERHPHWVTSSVQLSADAVASSCYDGGLRIWSGISGSATNPKPKLRLEASLWGHTDAVTGLVRPRSASPDCLLSCSLDGSVRLWSVDRIPPRGVDDGTARQPRMFALSKHGPNDPPQQEPPPQAPQSVQAPQQQPAQPSTAKANGGFWSSLLSLRSQSPKEDDDMGIPSVIPQVVKPYCPAGLTGVDQLERAMWSRGPIKQSFYSLAASHDGTSVAAGASDGKTFLWDTREPSMGDIESPLFFLQGHTDVVRSLAMFPSSSMIVTASSDTTVKVWDMRKRGCLYTLFMHAASVWSIAQVDGGCNPSLLSCGLDGRAFSVSLAGGVAEASLLFRQRVPLTAITHGSSDNTVWVGDDRGTITQWAMRGEPFPNFQSVEDMEDALMSNSPQSLAPKSEAGNFMAAAVSSPATTVPAPTSPQPATPASASEAAATKGQSQGAQPPPPPPPKPLTGIEREQQFYQAMARRPTTPEPAATSSPLREIPCTSGITKHEVLDDKRRILTRREDGTVELWDVLRGTLVESFGRVDFSEKREELRSDVAVSSWFTVDTCTGALRVVLEHPSCFRARVHAKNLPNPPDTDALVNLGEAVLRGLFPSVTRAATTARVPFTLSLDPHVCVAQVQQLEKGVGTVGCASCFDLGDGDNCGAVVIDWITSCLVDGVTIPDSDLPHIRVSLIGPPEKPKTVRFNCLESATAKELCSAVAERFHVKLGGADASTAIELSCRDRQIPHDATIGTVRAFFWAKPEEMEIQFKQVKQR